ncbi:hypothetical protein SK128_016851, partial [Halocaridina rubra]
MSNSPQRESQNENISSTYRNHINTLGLMLTRNSVSENSIYKLAGRGDKGLPILHRSFLHILHPRMGGTGQEGPIGRSPAGTGPNPPLWCPAAAVTSPVNSLNSLAWTRRDPSTSQMQGQRITIVLSRRLISKPIA